MTLTSVDWLVLASDRIALDVIEIPNLVQCTVLAADVGLLAVMDRGKSGFDLTPFVSLGGIGDDTGFGESLGLLDVASQG